jgi:hypothetical protein
MSNVVTREQFIEACPVDLKKRIDDFFIFYMQKKKGPPAAAANSGSGSGSGFSTGPKAPAASSSTGSQQQQRYYQGKKTMSASMNSFKKPFEKASATSEFETVHSAFKGILSKLNENNHDVVWKEIVALNLGHFAAAPVADGNGDDGWSHVISGKKNSALASPANVTDLAQTMYLYSRNCHMYLREYIQLITLFKLNKDLILYGNQYVETVLHDLDHAKEQKEYNLLTHAVACELFNRGHITKSKFIETCLAQMCDGTEAHTEILLQNMTKCGKLVCKQKSVAEIIATLTTWAREKKFSGKIHYNLIDLLELIEEAF